jgi:hypothetical protein
MKQNIRSIIGVNKFIRWVFSRVYRNQLRDPASQKISQVLMVRSWRSAIILDQHRKRKFVTFCFWGLD